MRSLLPALALFISLAIAGKAQAIATIISEPNDDGLFTVQAFNVIPGGGSNDDNLDNTPETLTIWDFLDANPGFTGTTPSLSGKIYNIENNHMDTEAVINYGGGGGDFGGTIPYTAISGGAGLGVDDFSVRGITFMEFTVGGTFSIAAGSDDGRRIELTEAFSGSAPGYAGFSDAGDQEDIFTGAGDTVVGFNGTTGHDQSVGEFTVAAGDILRLDSFFFERAGGDSFEISITDVGTTTFTTGGPNPFVLLADGVFGIQLSSQLNQIFIPEPSSFALVGLSLVGLARVRRRKWLR